MLSFTHLAAVLIIGTLPLTAAAQGDGPRAYFPAPGNTHIVSGFGFFNRGNQSFSPGTVISGGDVDVDVAAVQYAYGWDWWSHSGGLLLVLPSGTVDGSVSLPNQTIRNTSSGLADIQVGVAFGLVGLPYVSREDFLQLDPGLTVAVVGRWTIDSGEYDSDQPINLGANRDSLQLLLPIAWYLGDSVADPSLTSLELVPSITVFGDNDNPFGASKVEQKALYRLEAHATRNFNQALWGSLDAFYQFGGTTTTDGINNDDEQDSFNLGITVGMNLSASFAVQASYGETISHQTDGLDGSMIRVKLQFLF